jgi:DNA recombination protein RmuC
MELIVGVLVGLVVGAAAVIALVRTRRGPPAGDSLTRELIDMRAEVRQLNERIALDNSTLGRRLEGIDDRMSQTQNTNAHLAQGIFETLGDVRQATTTVAEQAREFASLQDLLKAPKARGGIGEAMLEELLRQILPPHGYSTQHRFKSGAVVDAVVRAGGRLVCIDSKFPLSNYKRMCDATDDLERAGAERDFAADVDRHIKDIATKYVVPDEGTFDFAVMYVPAEGLYGEVLRMSHQRRPLFESAIAARVVPMSPLTMYGYLQTILFGLKCLSIEKSAEAILSYCGRLQQDIERFAGEYETLGKHLGNARTKYEEGSRRLDRFRDKLEQAVEIADDSSEALAIDLTDDPRDALAVELPDDSPGSTPPHIRAL